MTNGETVVWEPIPLDVFAIRRSAGPGPAGTVFPDQELATNAARREGPVRHARFTLNAGEALAVRVTGGTDTRRLYLDYATAFAAAQEKLRYVVILVPSPWNVTATSAGGSTVVLGSTAGWKHDFIENRLEYVD